MIFLSVGPYFCRCSSGDNGGNHMPVITIHPKSSKKSSCSACVHLPLFGFNVKSSVFEDDDG